MFDLHVVWAYVDPVTVLPVTSIIATVVGVSVLGGQSIFQAVVRWARLATLQWRGGTDLIGNQFERTSGRMKDQTPSRRDILKRDCFTGRDCLT